MAVGDASERPDPPSTWAEGTLQVTPRPDTLVSPAETARDRSSVVTSKELAASSGVTPHSIVRPLPLPES